MSRCEISYSLFRTVEFPILTFTTLNFFDFKCKTTGRSGSFSFVKFIKDSYYKFGKMAGACLAKTHSICGDSFGAGFTANRAAHGH